jgi:hypothetical protein
MKERIILWLCTYSYRILTYIFWIYFLFVIIYDALGKELSDMIVYLFWFLLGGYLGYTIALRVIKYMRKKNF